MRTWTTLDISRMFVAVYAANMSPYRCTESREAAIYRQGFISAIRALAIAFDLPQVAALMSEALTPDTITTTYYYLEDHQVRG